MHKLTFSLTLFIKIFSYKEKRTHISLNKKSNTEFYTDDILSSLSSILQTHKRVKWDAKK